MSVRTVELHTCDDCKNLILIGNSGITVQSTEGRLVARWIGGFQDQGTIPKGHAPAPMEKAKGCNVGPFDGLSNESNNRSISLCRSCIARRFNFKDDSPVEKEAVVVNTTTRFDHKDPV